jgi:hypothetical protein
MLDAPTRPDAGPTPGCTTVTMAARTSRATTSPCRAPVTVRAAAGQTGSGWPCPLVQQGRGLLATHPHQTVGLEWQERGSHQRYHRCASFGPVWWCSTPFHPTDHCVGACKHAVVEHTQSFHITAPHARASQGVRAGYVRDDVSGSGVPTRPSGPAKPQLMPDETTAASDGPPG